MSTRKLNFISKSVNHPDRLCDMASDYLISRNENMFGEIKTNIFSVRSGHDVHSSGCALFKKDSVTEDGVKRSSKFDVGTLLKDLNIYDNVFKEEPKEQLYNKKVSYYRDELDEDSAYVMGYAVSETPCNIPIAKYIVDIIQDKAYQKIWEYCGGDNRMPYIEVMCEYDIEEDALTNLSIRTIYPNDVIGGISFKEMFQNNEFGFDQDTLSRIKNEEMCGTSELGVSTLITFQNHSGFSQGHLFGRSKANTPYPPYMGGYNTAGKDLRHVKRGGVYLARYIAKNIAGTGKFNEVTVYLNYWNLFEGATPNLLVKAKMFGSAEVEFEFPDHFNEDLFNIFSFDLYKMKEQFDSMNVSYDDLSYAGDVGYSKLNLPWEKLDKVKEVDEIKF